MTWARSSLFIIPVYAPRRSVRSMGVLTRVQNHLMEIHDGDVLGTGVSEGSRVKKDVPAELRNRCCSQLSLAGGRAPSIEASPVGARSWAREAKCNRASAPAAAGTPILQKYHDEPRGFRCTRVAPHRMHVVRTFVESLPWAQRDLLAAPDFHDDRPFQNVYESICIVAMDRVDRSRRILDGEHYHLLSRHLYDVLPQQARHDSVRRGLGDRCELGTARE